jgi:hypothetical protein
MPKCSFQYQAGDGQFTERTISDWSTSSPDFIDAHCELRKEQRTFNLKKMAHLVDLETGEVIADPWSFFGLTSTSAEANGRQSLDVLTWEALPAIRALKFFIITTRGFSKRERLKLVLFVEEVCNVSNYSKGELEEWLQNIWCANVHDYSSGKTKEYAELLQTVPTKLMPRCQAYALSIARGSGRKETDPFWLLRIESEFSKTPHVPAPPLRRDDGED